MGPSTAELESLNELIKFDHVYFKHESSTADAGLEKIHQCENKNSPVKVNIHITQDISSNTDNLVKTEQELPEGAIDENDLNDINMELLNEIESLIGVDFQDQLEQNLMESISQSGHFIENTQNLQKAEMNIDSNVNDRKRKRLESSSPLSAVDMYESTDNYGHDSSVLSDSGFHSDLSEACSPLSDVSSGLNEDPWEESFMELFPTLA